LRCNKRCAVRISAVCCLVWAVIVHLQLYSYIQDDAYWSTVRVLGGTSTLHQLKTKRLILADLYDYQVVYGIRYIQPTWGVVGRPRQGKVKIDYPGGKR
jgi:hypothetical protein